ncbi:MAG: DUF6057 family protein [Tannerellaceae bacterium]|jgi:hypothetical protein|nr:DUF6057 family protein [Tannerellaceae bacterium]
MRIFRIAGAAIAVFAWLYGFNRFQVFYYQEQFQLFRADALYLRTFLSQPGGLAGYAGAFLTQFFVILPVGALIYTIVLEVLRRSFYKVLAGFITGGALFFISLVPVALLLIPIVQIQSNIASVIGLLCTLPAFLLYRRANARWRYAAGAGLMLAVFFAAAAHVWVLAALIAIHEWFGRRGPSRYPGVALPTALSLLIPWAAQQWVYTAPIDTSFYACLAWWSVPAIYLLCCLQGPRIAEYFRRRPQVGIALSILCLAATLAHVVSKYDRTTETILHIDYEIRHGRYDRALDIKARTSSDSRHVLYLANIALLETGRMPDEMFRFRQAGPAGLFLDRNGSYFSYIYLGEIYYRLGLMGAARHCAYESMVAWSQKPNAQTLAQLARIALVEGDFAVCDKYLRSFEGALFYRSWAGEQRRFLDERRRNPAFIPPHIPAPVAGLENFFINYNAPEAMMKKILEADSLHRKAFEYLMAFYLLSKDVESAKGLMDRYYAGLGYSALPASFEEAMLVYENAVGQPHTYIISANARQRFSQYLRAAQSGANRNWMQQHYGDTYWFYLHYVQPVPLQTSSESNRY